MLLEYKNAKRSKVEKITDELAKPSHRHAFISVCHNVGKYLK